jgi:hypothetical protein
VVFAYLSHGTRHFWKSGASGRLHPSPTPQCLYWQRNKVNANIVTFISPKIGEKKGEENCERGAAMMNYSKSMFRIQAVDFVRNLGKKYKPVV